MCFKLLTGKINCATTYPKDLQIIRPLQLRRPRIAAVFLVCSVIALSSMFVAPAFCQTDTSGKKVKATLNGFDTVSDTTSYIPDLSIYSLKYIGRYVFSRTQVSEIQAIHGAGYQVVSLYEHNNGTDPTTYSYSVGVSDGTSAATNALGLGEPGGTTIFFGVDYDAPASDFPTLEQYFSGVEAGIDSVSGASYAVGVYGSGSVINDITTKIDGVDAAWESQSTGWTGYVKFGAPGNWFNITQGKEVTLPCGLMVDYDKSNGSTEGW